MISQSIMENKSSMTIGGLVFLEEVGKLSEFEIEVSKDLSTRPSLALVQVRKYSKIRIHKLLAQIIYSV